MSGYEPAMMHEIDQRHAEVEARISDALTRVREALADGTDPAVFAVETAVMEAAATPIMATDEGRLVQLTELYHLMNVMALRVVRLEDQAKDGTQ
jgi:hypothetical protein